MEVLKAKMQQSKDELENVREEAVMKEKMFQEEKRKREEIESHISSLSRKITLLEEDLDRSEERYNVANSKLASANQMAEESERLVKSLREKTDQDDGKLSLMEDQAASAKTLAEDSDRQVTEYINLYLTISAWFPSGRGGGFKKKKIIIIESFIKGPPLKEL